MSVPPIERIERQGVDEARRRLRALLAEALPIHSHVIAELPRHGRRLTPPVLHVGTKGRPDVADLIRVHAQEGPGFEGDAWSQLFAVTGRPIGMPRVFVHFRTLSPARCEFKLAFHLARHRVPLAALAVSGVIGISTVAPRVRGGRIATPMLLLEVTGTDLLRALLRQAMREGLIRA